MQAESTKRKQQQAVRQSGLAMIKNIRRRQRLSDPK